MTAPRYARLARAGWIYESADLDCRVTLAALAGAHHLRRGRAADAVVGAYARRERAAARLAAIVAEVTR